MARSRRSRPRHPSASERSIKTWFIRHWSDTKPVHHCTVAENRAVEKELFKKNHAAIHYRNICSKNPKDYAGQEQYIKKFLTMAKEGGYVCVNYPAINKMAVGFIRPESEILTQHKKSLCACKDSSRPALKKIAVRRWKKINSSSCRLRLLVAQPRGGHDVPLESYRIED